MKKRVLHFVRKSSQLKASFINNQINNHIDFEPSIIFRKRINKKNDGGFADFNFMNFPHLDLGENETLGEKMRFKINKTLSRRQLLLIQDFIATYNVQICHFHYGTDCGVFYPLLKEIEIPSVVSFYGYDSSSFPSYLFGFGKRYLKNRVFPNVNTVFAMSKDMQVDLIKAGCHENKIIVHYYGTDTKRFFLSHEHSKKSIYTILILASIVPQKGHMFLLKSIKNLIQKGIVNFRLRIVGTGELEQKIKSYVIKNELDEFVDFVGAIKYGSEEMLNEYKGADIFIHPSVVAPNGDKEGIPGTIIEAMSAGLPVVSTYHAGIPHIIENLETGLLVNEHSVEDLAQCLMDLISQFDLRKRIGLNGQNYAINNLDLSAKEKELEGIYNRLIEYP